MGRREEIVERVRALADPLAAQEGLELVEVALGGGGRTELTLFVDRLPGAPDAAPAAPVALSPGDVQEGEPAAAPGEGDEDEHQVVAVEPGPVRRRGVTLDECAAFSRIVSAALDVEDPLEGNYQLVVSSPGLDRPLRTPGHFVRHAGQRCRVKTYAPVPSCNNLKTFVGTLLGWDAEQKAVLVDVDGRRYAVPHAQVSKANLEPLFD